MASLPSSSSSSAAPASDPATTMVVVVVAVSPHGRSSRRAASWASEHLGSLPCRILLVHVIPPISHIPSPSGKMIPVEKMEKEVVVMYKNDANQRVLEALAPLKRLFGQRKVELMLLEGHDPAATLVSYVTENGIRNLVLGTSVDDFCFSRIISDADVTSTVLQKMPNHCNVIVVSRKKLKMKVSKEDDPTGLDSSIEVRSISHRVFFERERNWLLHEQFRHSFFGSESQQHGTGLTATAHNFVADDQVLKLKTDLQSTLAMYHKACEDLEQAKKKIQSLSIECSEVAKRVQHEMQRELALKTFKEIDETAHSEPSKQEGETLDRYGAEMIENEASVENCNVVNASLAKGKRCRRYSKEEIEEAADNFSAAKKIGEGSYGNVYRCTLDHTDVAIKVLKQDSKERMEEFLREVEILSHLHHPNMVLLLGFCPEIGTLVYEYMENGSLDDHFSYRNDKATPLPWSVRFRIVLEVACGLAFLHGAKPEPIVHRDLKPGNILLDQNFRSKIGDVGLAKLMSDVVPDGLTEYNETMLVGTLYYMDPEYQRTGTVRPKSDLYALGIITLQLLSGRHPNGLLVTIERAVENGSLAEVLDRSIQDWPLQAAERLVKLALRCCQLRCRDRPDLEHEFLPEMEEIMKMATGVYELERFNMRTVPGHFVCPILNEIMDDPYVAGDGHTYQYAAIKAWLEKSDVSPVTKQKLVYTSIIPNVSLRSAIQEWKLKGQFP